MPATKGSSTSPNNHIIAMMKAKNIAQNSNCCRKLIAFTPARMLRRLCSISGLRRIHVAHPSAQIESDRQQGQDNHESHHECENRLRAEAQGQGSELERRENDLRGSIQLGNKQRLH